MALAATRSIRPFTGVAPSLAAHFSKALAPRTRRATSSTTCKAAKEIFTAQEAADLLAQGYKYVDVRTPDEYKAGHVPGAVSIPLGPKLPVIFQEKFPLGTEKLVVGCQAGGRSTMALDALAGAYPEAINFKGSYGAWAAANMPIEK